MAELSHGHHSAAIRSVERTATRGQCASTAKGDYDRAIAEYRKAIGQREKFPAAHYDLGVALDAGGFWTGPSRHFCTANQSAAVLPRGFQSALDKALAAKSKP